MKIKLLIVLAFVLVVCTSKSSVAEEPAERFLEALREEGFHELAIQYLTGLESSDLVSPEFKKTIPFEKAGMLIDSVSRIQDFNEWEGRLDEAEALLKQFARDSDAPDVIAKTQLISGDLFRKRAKIYVKQSESDRLTASEKEDLVNKSREMLQNAENNYKASRSTLNEYLKNYQIDPSDPNSEKRLRLLRGLFTRIQFNQPVVIEQFADSYPEGDARRTQRLTEAAAEYKVVFDKFRRYPAGLDAGLSAARCEFKLGRFDESLFLLEQFFELQNNDTFRVIRRKAISLATDSWNRKDPFPFQDVIAVCDPSVRILSKQELRQPDWLKIQLTLAKAFRAKAEFVSKENKPGIAAQAKKLNNDAVRMAKNVARAPGDFREDAKVLLSEWNLKINDSDPEEVAPQTFVDARQKGQDIVSEVESIVDEISTIRQRLLASADNEKEAINEELLDAEQRLESQTDSALGFFELALSMVDDQTEREEINKVRYYQSFCYFATSRFFESALIGEFLLERYPSLNWSRQAAALSVRSYGQMFAKADKDERTFELTKMKSLTDQMVDRWPGSNETSMAARLVAGAALDSEDYVATEAYLEIVPDDFSRKNILSARLGQRLWFNHLRNKDTVDEQTQKTRVAAAKKHLEAGLKNVTAEDLTYENALAALLLIDAHLALNETDLALARLETETIAPLDLIKAKHPAIFESTTAELYIKEAYKSAIKTYLAVLKAGQDQATIVGKIRGVIQALQSDAVASGDPDDIKRLTTIYRMIATELKSQFDQIQSPQERQAFSKTIASFLDSIEKNANDAKTILWAGSTLMDIAESLNQQALESDAKPIFQQAVSALNRAEKIGFAGEENAAGLTLELRRQRALAERGAGNYESAVKQLSDILKESGNRLNIQIDAALTLHMWAKASARAQTYAAAMMGQDKIRDERTKQMANAIWGWRKILSVTRNNEKYVDEFNTSLYYLIESRFEYGVIENSNKAIASASQELKNARRRDATLGGPTWKPKFEELEKRINSKLK